MYLPLSLLCFAPLAVHIWEPCQQSTLRVSAPRITVKKRIAIIGGGTAGLAALKTFVYDIPKAENEEWEITLYERRERIGGVWLSDPDEPHSPQLPESPIYPSLHTNFAVPTMTFPGFPFPEYTPLYPSHRHILAYHADYADHHNLHPHIMLNHSVSSARWAGNSTHGHWVIALETGHPREVIPGFGSQLAYTNDSYVEQFDHLIIANGHNHYPAIPGWSRNTDWLNGGIGRSIVHSVFFREAQDFAGKKVLVVGGGPSGVDVVSQVSEYAAKTYHSFKTEPGRPWPPLANVSYRPRTSHMTQSSVIFDDGTEEPEIDTIILATGYETRYPFLCNKDPYGSNSALHGQSVLVIDPHAKSRPNGPIATNLRYIFPVHKQIISLSTLHPLNALGFVGLPYPIANAGSDIVQSLFIGHMIANRELVFPGSEVAVRERLLDELTAHEDELRGQGLDPYIVGHKLVGVNNTGDDYQEGLYSHLKASGAIPNHGQKYLEKWRIFGVRNVFPLARIWKAVQNRGEEMSWLEGVRTEEDWGDLLYRLFRWGESVGL